MSARRRIAGTDLYAQPAQRYGSCAREIYTAEGALLGQAWRTSARLGRPMRWVASQASGNAVGTCSTLADAALALQAATS